MQKKLGKRSPPPLKTLIDPAHVRAVISTELRNKQPLALGLEVFSTHDFVSDIPSAERLTLEK